MKILILIDAWFPFRGGAQVQIKNLKEILTRDYQTEYHILHSPSSHIIIRFFWFFWVIPWAILSNRKESFDLIHCHAYWPGIPGKILSKLLRLPVVFTVHGSNLLDLKARSFRAWLEKIILTQIKYDQVISVSKHFLQYKNINKNIHIIPNGVNVGEFDKIKVDKEKPYKVLFVGRDDPIKGLKYLKKAMMVVKRQIPQARLKIIENGFSKTQLIKEYKSSHLFVLPSLSEGQPLTLLEAWAAELPVIVTRAGDNARFVKNNYNGYLVKPKKTQALAEAMIKVLNDQNREKLGRRGYQLVKERYSWEKCAQKTYEIYQKIIKQ